MDLHDLKNAQKEAFNIIENSFKNNRLSHAYIFEGDAGTMKLDAALFFAAKLFCSEDETPCMECHNCQRILNQTHPNLYVVKLQKTAIVKDDILALQSEFSKTALEDGPKIYIIESAEKMNVHAQNTLLKFLEEPTSETYAILLSEDANKMLPTIQSRSQRITFHRLSETAIEKKLTQDGFEQTYAKLAARMCPTVEEAKTLLETSDLDELIDLTDNIYSALANDASPLLTLQKEGDGFFRDKEKTDMLLDVFIHYQKDLIYGKINNRSQMVFGDSIDTIETLSENLSLDHMVKILEKMLEMKLRQRNHINMRLAFDNLMIALEKGEYHEK